jgi:Na+-translocating ferredoxin:NAD+ oxidoreductase RnfG subunit
MRVQGAILAIVSTALCVCAAGASAQEIPTEEEIGIVQVLQSERAALAEIFPDADSAYVRSVAVDSTMSSELKGRLGRRVSDSVFAVYDVYFSGQQIGCAVIADEQGKYRPITFMAGIDTLLRVVDVRVLVYRESRGGEVQHSRFLKQYRGKSLENPIRINRDIVNITGATISVNSLNAGVRKALAVAEYLKEISK